MITLKPQVKKFEDAIFYTWEMNGVTLRVKHYAPTNTPYRHYQAGMLFSFVVITPDGKTHLHTSRNKAIATFKHYINKFASH